MHTLSAAELLRVWERGLGDNPIRRAIQLLSAACPDSDLEEIRQLSIGQRDSLLLGLRERTFGRDLTGISRCSGCNEQIELAFATSDFPQKKAALPMVERGSYKLELRPLNSADLEDVMDRDPRQARRGLLELCTLSARCQGEPVVASDLPSEVLDEAERQLAEADPQSDIQLMLSCPACGTKNRVVFDIVSFFWREIESWAVRILREVHTLALAYGWREEDILALSPVRRQCYLDLIGA